MGFSTELLSRRDILRTSVSAVAINALPTAIAEESTASTVEKTNKQERCSRITVSQGSKQYTISPLVRDQPVEEFYNYTDTEAHTPLDLSKSNAALLFFYDGPRGLSLVVIFDRRDDNQWGRAKMAFDGLPDDGQWVVTDDPRDADRIGSPEHYGNTVVWKWNDNHTDGGAFRGLNDDFRITVEPFFQHGIERWEVLTATSEGLEHRTLALDEPVTFRKSSIRLRDTRLVQTVENCRLDTSSSSTVADRKLTPHPKAPNPPLVVGRSTAIVFDITSALNSSDVDNHSSGQSVSSACPLTIQVQRYHGSEKIPHVEEFTLPRVSVEKALAPEGTLLDQFAGLERLPIEDDTAYVQGQQLYREKGIDDNATINLVDTDSEETILVLDASKGTSGRVEIPPDLGDIFNNPDLSSILEPLRQNRFQKGPLQRIPLNSGNYAIVDDGDTIAEFELQPYPVFDIDAELARVDVGIFPGPNTDDSGIINLRPPTAETTIFPKELVDMPTLDVGFVVVEDRAEEYEDVGRLAAGESDRRKAYATFVERSAEYIQRTFPTAEVRVYRHSIEDSVQIQSENPDKRRARVRLDEAISRAKQSGAEAPGLFFKVTDGEAQNVDVELDNFEFDATFAVVPSNHGVFGVHPNNDFDPLGNSPPERQPDASSMGRIEQATAIGPRNTAAHEISHHLASGIYTGNLKEDVGTSGNPWSHPTQDLRTTRYDLEAGRFYVDADTISFVAHQGNRTQKRWMDGVLYHSLITDKFEPTPPIGDDWAAFNEYLIGGTWSFGDSLLDGLISVGDSFVDWAVKPSQEFLRSIPVIGSELERVISGLGGWIGWTLMGYFDWAADTVMGPMAWFGSSFLGAASWAGSGADGLVDWATSGANLGDGVKGALDWTGDGIKGAVDRTVDGAFGVAHWGADTLSGVANWAWPFS